ncbi:MAG: Uncharacterized protein G01um101429_490 [Parcubacteria group bacterium Gr01-1014_29]|nr:MAG: Uncharacterized protein G01um101429_490 [Parcubacteria group bacterium Gr01-1014_29]
MFLHKVQLMVIIASMVLIPLVYWHGVFFPHTFIKTVTLYTLVELAVFGWLLLMLFREEYRLRFSPLTAAIAGFLFISSLAAFFGVDGSKSVWSDYERMFGIVTWFHLGAFFLVLSSIVRKKRDWDLLFGAVVGTAAFVGLIAIWQGFTSDDLSISTIGNAAYLSSYLVPAFFLALFLVIREGHASLWAWLYGICAIVIVLALPFTEARAGVVGLGAGIFISLMLFLFWGDRQGTSFSIAHATLKRAAYGILAVGVASAAVLLFAPEFSKTFLPEPLHSLFDFNVQERTASGRFLVWRVAWEGWKERPLAGWGPENFNILFNEKYDPELYRFEPWFDRAHNFVFDIGSTSGFAGLLAYIGMFGTAFFMAVRQWRSNTMPLYTFAMVCSVLGAHLTQNLFTFDTLSSFLLVCFVFGYVAAHYAHNSPSHPARVGFGTQKKGRAVFAAGLGAVILAAVWYMAVAKPVFANVAAHQGWELLRTGGGDDAAMAQFEKSISYNTPYSNDARRFAAEYVFEFLKQGGSRPDASLRRLTEYAIEKMSESIADEPKNVKWVMYRGELYSIMAQKFDSAFAVRAYEDFSRARAMSPGRPHVYLQLAQVFKMQGDMDAAWRAIDYVIDAIPDFVFGHLNAAVLAIETNNGIREKQEVTWLLENEELDNSAIRDAYFKKERYGEALAVQEDIVAQYERGAYAPASRAVEYARLAALYQLAGDIEKARVAVLTVLKLDPARKSEVEAFLKTLAH